MTEPIYDFPTSFGVDEVRKMFKSLYSRWLMAEDYSDDAEKPMFEILNLSFTADDNHIFGAPNDEYIRREMDWYYSQSLSVFDIPGGPPKIWERVADSHGFINSNYGYLLFSDANGRQFDNVMNTLQTAKYSRQAVAVYTRPSIHDDAWHNGKSDFICTNTVQYQIRDDTLHTLVSMRSNDAVFGYRNDFAWLWHIASEIARNLGIEQGDITWQVANLHIYPRHLGLLAQYADTGVHDAAL